MRVLQICSKMPLPETDGGCRAMAELSRGLFEQGVELYVAGFKTHKHPGTTKTENSGPFEKPVFPIHTDIKIRPAALLRNLLFSKSSYNLARFNSNIIQHQCTALIKEIKPDVIILDGFFSSPLLPCIRATTTAKVVYRSHNVEWKLWQSRAGNTKNLLARAYFNTMAKRLRAEEESFAKEVDAFLFISEEDEAFCKTLAGKTKGMLLPFTIKDPQPAGSDKHEGIVFYHLGAMDWFPNVRGIQWFLKEVWPEFRQQRPKARMLLAGKGMSEDWKKAEIPGVTILGEIEHPLELLEQADVLIAPVFSASGVRIKILEALSHGKPVITQTEGKQGLLEKHLQGVITANDADEYLRAMMELYDSPAKCRVLSAGALHYTKACHHREKIYKSLADFLQEISKPA